MAVDAECWAQPYGQFPQSYDRYFSKIQNPMWLFVPIDSELAPALEKVIYNEAWVRPNLIDQLGPFARICLSGYSRSRSNHSFGTAILASRYGRRVMPEKINELILAFLLHDMSQTYIPHLDRKCNLPDHNTLLKKTLDESGLSDELEKFGYKTGELMRLKEKAEGRLDIDWLEYSIGDLIHTVSSNYSFTYMMNESRKVENCINWYDPRKGGIDLDDVCGEEGPEDIRDAADVVCSAVTSHNMYEVLDIVERLFMKGFEERVEAGKNRLEELASPFDLIGLLNTPEIEPYRDLILSGKFKMVGTIEAKERHLIEDKKRKIGVKERVPEEFVVCLPPNKKPSLLGVKVEDDDHPPRTVEEILGKHGKETLEFFETLEKYRIYIPLK